MLEPLNPKKIRAIVGEEGDLDCINIRQAKSFFSRNDVIQGLRNLLDAFRLWKAYLFHEYSRREMWYITFRDPPFDSLYLVANGSNVEIFTSRRYMTPKKAREVFRHKKSTASIEVLGRPGNWVLLLQWLWEYGDQIYINDVEKGIVLRPLDYRKLALIAEDGNASDCDSVRRIKTYLGEEKDLARGIVCLFEGWEIFAPLLHRDNEAENIWHITFHDSPFRSLRIQPSTHHGVIDVYAFNKYIRSFRVIDHPEFLDRNVWRNLLEFIWDYGKRRREHKKQLEETRHLSPKICTGAQSQTRRTEKPLLHKVLHTANFKAPRAAIPRAKNTKTIPDAESNVMGDLDTETRVDEYSIHQLFNQQPPLLPTLANAQLETPMDVECTKTGQTADFDTDDIKVKDLEITDHPS